MRPPPSGRAPAGVPREPRGVSTDATRSVAPYRKKSAPIEVAACRGAESECSTGLLAYVRVNVHHEHRRPGEAPSGDTARSRCPSGRRRTVAIARFRVGFGKGGASWNSGAADDREPGRRAQARAISSSTSRRPEAQPRRVRRTRTNSASDRQPSPASMRR